MHLGRRHDEGTLTSEQISFGKMRKLIDWGESLDTDPIPNTLSALYAVEIIVDRGQAHASLKVDGQIRFYVKPAEGRVDGIVDDRRGDVLDDTAHQAFR